MNKECFKILKEINSLNGKLRELKAIIKDELARIDKIEETRTERRDQKELNEATYKALKSDLLDIDKKSEKQDLIITDSKSKIPQVFDEKELNALNSQISNAEKELDALQESGLELLDQADELEKSISTATTFLAGSLETVKEIEQEITESNETILTEIKTINHRLELLHEQIPPKASERILKLLKEKPKLSPLAHISSTKNCDVCGHLLASVVERAVEVDLKLVSCPGCTRILIPQSTKF